MTKWFTIKSKDEGKQWLTMNSQIVCKFKHDFSSANPHLHSSTCFSLLCSKWPMVDNVQVLHRWLVVSRHGNGLLEFAIWLQLEHSANLKGRRRANVVAGTKELNIYKVRMRWVKLPVGHVVPWQKRFWLQPGSVAPDAGPSVPPPRSPPGLHKKAAGDVMHLWCFERG